jgi:hypothetical protein
MIRFLRRGVVPNALHVHSARQFVRVPKNTHGQPVNRASPSRFTQGPTSAGTVCNVWRNSVSQESRELEKSSKLFGRRRS